MYRNNLNGIMLMIVNAMSLAALYAVMKLVTMHINSNIAVFFYKFTLFILILPWVFYKDGIKAIKTPNLKLHFYRSIFSTVGSLSLIYSLNYLNLIDITVLTQLEQMLWLIIGAIFFHEKLTFNKVIAILCGIIGGFFITRPELIHNIFSGDKISIPIFNRAYVFIGITVSCWSINSTLVKILGNRNASNRAQLFYVMLFSSIFSGFIACIDCNFVQIGIMTVPIPKIHPALYSIVMDIRPWHILSILISALFYLIHNVAFFNAMRFGEMTVIAPFVYFKMIFAGILGYYIFGEHIKMDISYIGYALIVTAGIILMFNQYWDRRKKSPLDVI